jgi:hypothetical protein
METAKYIYSILKTQLMVVWSWGFNSPMALTNGLQFKVQGFIFKGWVKITYNEGKDLFDISFLNYQMEITKKIEDVYFDMLVDVIDNEVEKVQNYENRIKQEYSIF